MQCSRISTISSLFSAVHSQKRHIQFDLQLFNQEKTEEATPKRRSEARNKGQVAKSVEINSAFVILAAFFTLKLIGPFMYGELTNLYRYVYSDFSTKDFTINYIYVLFLNLSMIFFKVAFPVMLVILIVSLFINVMQVGFHFTFEPLMPNFERLNPIAGFQRLFSKRSLVELVKSLLKVVIIGYFIYRFIMKEVSELPALISAEPAYSLFTAASLSLDIAFQIGAVMLVLAALDYYYQWWDFNKSIKMSKQDVKEEYKQTEGNPQIKSKIKERQRALAMRRMMQDVPKADVIVTNPTHYAVALKYEQGMTAPTVLAKGQDLVAQRIKQIALENKIVTVENKPLARALFAAVEVGDMVPQELYQAVAEVLAYVYRLKKRLK